MNHLNPQKPFAIEKENILRGENCYKSRVFKRYLSKKAD